MASKFVNTVFHGIYISVVIVIFSLLLAAYIKIGSTEYQYIERIGKNWNKGPLFNITTDKYSCKDNSENLIEDFWPGTVEGCDCSNSINIFSDPLTRGSCSSRSSNRRSSSSSYSYSTYLCNRVSPTPAVPYSYWGGRAICGLRENQDYLNLTVASEASKCPNETRSCGIIDSLNNVLCVSTSSLCPINKIVFIDQKESLPVDFKYSTIQLETGKIIAFTTMDTSAEIPVEFKLTEGEPCLNPSYTYVQSNQYILSKLYGSGICPETGRENQREDSRYSKVDSDDLFDVYTMNGIEDTLRRLPLYQKTSNLPMNLFVREYIGLTEECREKINESEEGGEALIKTLITFESNIGGILGWIIAAFVVGCIGLVVQCCVPCVVCGDKSNSLNKLPVPLLVWYFIYSVLLAIFIFVANHKAKNLPSNYSLLGGNCSDVFTNDVIAEFQNKFPQGVELALTALILSFGSFALNFVFLWLNLTSKDYVAPLIENES